MTNLVQTSPLQTFSELVATQVEGPPADPGAIGWLAIVEMIMAIISEIMSNCNANDTALREACKKPSMWQRVRTRLVVRDYAADGYGLRWHNRSSEITHAILSFGAVQPDETIDAVICQIRNPAF